MLFYSQTVIYAPEYVGREWLFFLFSGQPAAPARDKQKTANKVVQSCPDKPLSAKLGLLPSKEEKQERKPPGSFIYP